MKKNEEMRKQFEEKRAKEMEQKRQRAKMKEMEIENAIKINEQKLKEK